MSTFAKIFTVLICGGVGTLASLFAAYGLSVWIVSKTGVWRR